MKTYEITIERTEVTILQVEADTENEACCTAMQRYEAGARNYGIAETNITDAKEIQND